MKKTTIIVLMMISSVGFTMDASVLKDAALKACETQLESVPENMREQSKKICLCNVNKTDYAAVLAAQASGDMTKVQENAVKNAQECATEM
jgi:hypothetical protein